jgi:hypothetical protein
LRWVRRISYPVLRTPFLVLSVLRTRLRLIDGDLRTETGIGAEAREVRRNTKAKMPSLTGRLVRSLFLIAFRGVCHEMRRFAYRGSRLTSMKRSKRPPNTRQRQSRWVAGEAR